MARCKNQTLAGTDKGNALFKEIKEYAVSTPMMMKDLAQGAQIMLAFNIEAEKVMPILKAIGDISMGDAQKFNSLTLAFSQMSATGKLMGQDLLQMINAGFNPLAVISEKTGKTIGELKEEMEKGKITTDKVTQAFMDATSEGGKFHGMLENQSKGIAGSISNLQGAIDDMMNEIGSAAEGTIVTAVNATTSLVKNYEQVGRVLVGVISTYGAYKAALIAVTACQGWASAAEALHYYWLVLVEKAQKMLNATMLSNPYVLVATLIAGVVAAMVSMKTEAELLKETEEEYEYQKQQVIEAEQKHREEIDKLCSIAEDEALSTDTRRIALHKLEEKYPDIFAKYQTETEMLENIKKIKQEIAELDGKKSITNPKNELAEVNKRIAELEKKKATGHEEWVEANASGTKYKKIKVGGLTAQEERELKMLKDKRTKLQGESKKADADAYFADLSGISNSELDRQITVRKNLLAKMEMGGNTRGGIVGNIPHSGSYSKDELQAQLQALERQKKYREAESKSGAQWVADKKKAYNDATKAYNDYVNGVTSKGVKEEDFKKEAARLKEEMETAKKEYDKVKPSSNSGANRAAKVSHSNAQMLAEEAAERMRQSEEYARRMADQEKDNEFEIRQARIDAMKDGLDKELLQNKLNYDRLDEQNKRRLREMLDNLAEEKLRQKEDENPTIFKTKGKDGKFEDDPGKRDEELKTIRLSLNVDDLSSEQKQQFEEFGKIAAEAFEVANENSMTRLLGEYVDFNRQKTDITEEWERTRSLIPVKYGIEANNKIREQLGNLEFDSIKKEFNWESVFANYENMASATLDGLIKKLESYRDKIEKTFDPKIIGEYNDALLKLQKAQRANDKNVWSSFIPQAIREQKEYEEEINAKKIEYNRLLDKQHEKENEVKEKIIEIQKALKDMTGEDYATEDIADPNNLQGIIDTLQKTNPDGAKNISSMSASLQTMQSELGGITQAAGEAGTALMGMEGGGMDALEKVGAIVYAINDSVQSAKALIDDLSNTADALGADTEIGSGWDTATTIMDGFAEASQGATDAFESFKSGNPIGVIQGVVKSFTGWIRAFAAIHDAKHERTIQKLQDQIEDLEDAYKRLDREIDKVFSKDASNLLNQKAEMIEQQRKLITMQIEEEKAKKNIDEDKIKDWEKQLKDLEEDYEDAKEAAVDAIFGEDIKSAIENFADAYAEAWANSEDRAKSAKDVVKQMMKNMVMESIKAAIQSSGAMERIREKLQEFYADNVLSDWEQDYIYRMAEELQEDIDNQFGWAESLLSDDAERQASQKGIATADQDSVDELNGRMTAVQSHTYSISENTKLLLSTTQSILQSVMNIESETDGFSARLERMEGNIKTMTNTLDDIATKGIRLKS
ncbi:MAG: tape measure protein [Lepagella sp.]